MFAINRWPRVRAYAPPGPQRQCQRSHDVRRQKRSAAAATQTQRELQQVASDMTRLWHWPWRTYAWPQRLQDVAQRWMAGELACARRVGLASFRDILLGIRNHDRTADARHFADFVLLWARSVQATFAEPQSLDGPETTDALEAVAGHLMVVRSQYREVFAPHHLEALDREAVAVCGLANQMRGGGPRPPI